MSNEAVVTTPGTTPLLLVAGANVTLSVVGTTLVVAASAASGGVTTFNGRSGVVVPAANDYTFAQLATKPTTLAGYGITDALALAGGTMSGDILANTAGARSIGVLATPFLTYFGRNVQSDVGLNLKIGSGSVVVSVAGTTLVSILAGFFFPTDQALQLGGSANRWQGIWTDGATNKPFTITNATVTVGASVGTLSNCPTAGNPTGYLQVSINGVTAKIPYWT